MTEEKEHITLHNKLSGKNFLSTSKAPLSRFAGVHENTIWNMYRVAMENNGFFENARWLMIITAERIKGDRGRKNFNVIKT